MTEEKKETKSVIEQHITGLEGHIVCVSQIPGTERYICNRCQALLEHDHDTMWVGTEADGRYHQENKLLDKFCWNCGANVEKQVLTNKDKDNETPAV